MKLFFVLLPKNLLSRITGYLSALQVKPLFLKNFILRSFANAFSIDLNEAEFPIEQYPSLNKFFTRKLKKGARPLHSDHWIHPCDSLVLQMGEMRDSRCIQAKGKSYTGRDLVGEENKSKFFITYYLCPTDYHRVHAPFSGNIKSVTHIPGNLWPVNFWSVENIENLYCVNERMVVEIENASGTWFVVFVGATNVGKITLAFDESLVSNQKDQRAIRKKVYSKPIAIQIGDELGTFHMGSTIVLLSPLHPQAKVKVGDHVKIGQAF